MFQIKQYSPPRHVVSEWQLEEAQVFWAKKEESLALSLLREMIKALDEDGFKVICCTVCCLHLRVAVLITTGEKDMQ